MRYILIPISERRPSDRCWFCRTDKSVKYRGKFINPNPTAENRYIHILICSKCALNHSKDLIEEEL